MIAHNLPVIITNLPSDTAVLRDCTQNNFIVMDNNFEKLSTIKRLSTVTAIRNGKSIYSRYF